MRYFFLVFLLLYIPSFAEELRVDLKNPKYEKGVLYTREGGVISSEELRIQGKEIAYTHPFGKENESHQIVVEGDLMFTNQKCTYVGRRLEYDFITKTGVLYDGVAAFDVWFLKGERIELNQDRSLHFCNAFITTSENQKPDWKIQIKEGDLIQKHLFVAKNISVRLLDFPIFWLPLFKSNLKTFSRFPITYRIDWDSGLYPRFSLRYCIYSWEKLALYFRLNIRPSKGIGGALETDYRSFDHRFQCRTRSYFDKDTFYRDTSPKKSQMHYRLQGKYCAKTVNERIRFLATYDYLSDKNMQTGFDRKDFELQTAKETKLRIRSDQKQGVFGVDADFRINSFQGLLQKLPEVFYVFKPIQLGSTGIIVNSQIKGGYLSYVSAKDLQKYLPAFRSTRLSTSHSFYRSFYAHGFSLTPLITFNGVFYGNTRKQHPETLAVCIYQLFTDYTLKRSYASGLHVVTPYMHYRGMSEPTINFWTPYIFSIEDGFHRLNLVKLGVRNLFYLKQFPLFEPNFVADIHMYHFLGDVPFKKGFPKAQATLNWNFPYWMLRTSLGWNFEKQILDYANVSFAWTISSHFAFASEFRHRSAFDWRKANRDNFILEVTQPISDLRHSPLSDQRNTFLTRLQMKLHPEWVMRLESRMGWGREKEPSYQEAKVQLITTMSTSWRIRFSFIHSLTPSQRNNHFTFSVSLIKKRLTYPVQ